jgi:L-iditol 2-dehydrogenase
LCTNLKELGSTINGGFAEYLEIPDKILEIGGLVPIPTTLSDGEAALLEPLACCINSVSRTCNGRQLESKVVIIGDGPIGLMHLQLFKMAHQKVCVVGKIESRMRKAKDLGADMVIPYGTVDTTHQSISEFFSITGADSVIIATSNPSALELAEKIAGKNSTINLFAGLPQGCSLQIDANRVHYDQISVIGSFGCTPSLMSKASEIVAQGKIDLSSMVTHHYSLAELGSALFDTENYAGLRAVIDSFDSVV